MSIYFFSHFKITKSNINISICIDKFAQFIYICNITPKLYAFINRHIYSFKSKNLFSSKHKHSSSSSAIYINNKQNEEKPTYWHATHETSIAVLRMTGNSDYGTKNSGVMYNKIF